MLRRRLAHQRFDLLEGAKGVQLAELGLQSWAERRWVDVPALSLDSTASKAEEK